MTEDGKWTLIDDLLLSLKPFKGKFKNYKSVRYFIDLVFPKFEEYSKLSTPLFRSEVYTAYRNNDFHNYAYCYAYISDETSIYEEEGISWRKIREKSIHKFVKQCIEEKSLGNLKDCMMELLSKDSSIHEELLSKKLAEAISQLRTFSDMTDGGMSEKLIDTWVKHIYYYFYYAVTFKLHSELALSMYPGLSDDLLEYNKEITMMYGATGNPGMYKLYSLANRRDPNIIALYECGEMEYYGKGASGRVNYNEAYRYYEKTRNCNNEHPLAAWSIAYMRFHYSQEYAKEYSEYRVAQFEAELSNGKGYSWYDAIIYNASIAYDNGCSAAANLIGKILDCTDEEFPFARRGKFKERTSKELYKESADAKYVFGCNNYAMCCIDEANSEAIPQDETINKWKEAIKYLEKSAEMGNPWASNKVGNFYYNGLTVGCEEIIKKDEEKAYTAFMYAQIMSFSENYYWPIINLCEKYWLNTSSRYYKTKKESEIGEMIGIAIGRLKEKKCAVEKDKVSAIEQMEKLISIKDRIGAFL